MVTIQVHRHSLRVLTKLYGSPRIHLDKASPLLPILTSQPRPSRGLLSDQIHVIGPDHTLSEVHPDAGHNLHRLHMHQLYDWITMHVDMGQLAWPAMMDYYRVMDMTLDDLDPASVYRQWYRSQGQRKSKNNSYNPSDDVPKNMSQSRGALKSVFETAAYLIAADPDQFYTRAGRPDPYMIKKAIMYSMSEHHGWSQIDIAGTFGLCQSAVSRHLTPFRPTAVLI